jgi:hypothetical protein
LIVQLRAGEKRRAELRIRSGHESTNRLALNGASTTWTLEFDSLLEAPAVLVRQAASEQPARQTLEPWDPHEAIYSSLLAAVRRRGAADPSGPSLHDATRAMELAEATARSLRKGRTVDLYYEPISEEASFKSVMTSTGCMLFIGSMLILPLALAGPPLGFGWTIYIAYIIPPLLVLFVILQTLRFAVRKSEPADSGSTDGIIKNP